MVREGVFEREQRCGVRCSGERGEFPQAAPALPSLLFEEDASAVHGPCAVLGEFRPCAARLFAWQGFRGAVCRCDAGFPDRAFTAAWRARGADERAEFHERAIENACATFRHERDRLCPQRGLACGGVNGRVQVEQACEDAGDVGIHERLGEIVCEARNRARGVAADAGQRADVRGVARHCAAVRGDDGLRGAVEVARARVVAEALPEREHVIFLRCGERWKVREAREPAFVKRNDRRDLRLLEHDFRDEDRVWIPRATPRQNARRTPEPCGECAAGECGGGRGLRVRFGHRFG